MIKLHGPDNKEMIAIDALEKEGDVLIIKGRIFGTMPLTARLYPQDARAFLKMLNFKLAWFLISLPFRRSFKKK